MWGETSRTEKGRSRLTRTSLQSYYDPICAKPVLYSLVYTGLVLVHVLLNSECFDPLTTPGTYQRLESSTSICFLDLSSCHHGHIVIIHTKPTVSEGLPPR